MTPFVVLCVRVEEKEEKERDNYFHSVHGCVCRFREKKYPTTSERERERGETEREKGGERGISRDRKRETESRERGRKREGGERLTHIACLCLSGLRE